jgi:CubicO group peptidase (beta-lactamase class C family)
VSRLQFRILYCEFLLRIVDLDLLAAQGDTARLLGQFAALLVIASLWIMLPAVVTAGSPGSELGLILTWTSEHFLIATTMLAVGLFAVLSWESMFPDRRDVLVLGPLPVRARTLFSAKLAAVATALALTVICLNFIPGLGAPFAFSTALTMPPPKYDPAMPPVAVAGLQAVIDRDMAAADLPELGKDAGIAIGVVEHGERRVFTYGTARADSLFEIGSITKTFTALLLAQMVAEGKVRLDEPLRELLPQGLVAKPPGAEITLLDLATHHAGLSRMPDNFKLVDRRNPYPDYRTANLYAYMAKRGVARPPHPSFFYSNLGFALLGQALGNRGGTTYAELLRQEVTGPLGLPDTVVKLSRAQWERLLPGFRGTEPHDPAPNWNLDAFAGAGAIRSTAGDMLTYLEAQLHPERAGGLAAALAASHTLRAEVPGRMRIALAWVQEDDTGIYRHNGATVGYTSDAFFGPACDCAAVVLSNTSPNPVLGPDQLGDHIRQRLAGEAAVSLARPIIAGKGGLRNWLRSLAAYWIALFASGIFLLGAVLSVQGLAQLLPRQFFLRVSSVLQLACFCLFLLVYFLQPPFAGVDALVENQRLLPWLPSYWFFALFQQLNGPLSEPLIPLARRAWIGLALALGGAAGAYLICYFRTLRKIAEQPDILPGSHRVRWLPPFGNALETAVGQFAVRTLFRSRQHRVLLSFYLGIALGLAVFLSKAPVLREQRGADLWYQMNAPLLVASIVMVCGAVVGARVVFSMPLDLRANWIFRVMPPPNVVRCVAAGRRALYGLAAAPVLTAMAAFFFIIWPWRAAAGHLAVLALLVVIVAEVSLCGFRKIPFTCSYLPGRSYFHMAFIFFLGMMFVLNKGAALERSALEDPTSYGALVAILAAAAATSRCCASARAREEGTMVEFEDEPDPAVLPLGLHRDGVMLIKR